MSNARKTIEMIFDRAVKAVDPYAVISRNVEKDGAGAVRMGDREFEVPAGGVYVIGLGKASAGLADALVQQVPDNVRGGLVVTKHAPPSTIPGIEIIEGAHPVPDERSFEAGLRLLEFVDEIPIEALVVCLISGGGSALAEQLRSSIRPEKFTEVTGELLRSGADIYELNSVRSRLSEIKGGGLLQRLEGRTVVNLIISDVLGDDPRVIASGPTVPRENGDTAEQVVQRYGIDLELPSGRDRALRQPSTLILGSLTTALDAASAAAEGAGYPPFLLSSRLDGEARHIGRALATIALDAREDRSSIGRGVCLLAGGETTVQVRGDGRGGRNTEAALSGALRLVGSKGITLGFLATDGDDGETGAAGAIIDGATIPGGRLAEARRALENNDSYTLLEEVGADYSPGPTGTNVNDLVIGLIE